MGLMLFPGGYDVTHPDVSWSYHGFHMFREWLARVEGLELTGMAGFGGDRPWSEVATPLRPLLDHPDDDGPDLTPDRCAAMLPRLEAIRDLPVGDDPVLRSHLEDLDRLITVLRFCVAHDVPLVFA
ncbi:hypothetical protein LX16_0379 [Stackebrandtia albiflava]|uniref:Uncharacterized protein n=1 Tax=Stackebrandtia albiflava TaxID=406432 RepID=A0A562V9X7_9ACTN|nr:hypothetical protein [Stackebrandtia albiflava]TWJ14690.1 hypothetical protein LX16_0379 [Stackebrandtia albiflava]